MNLTLSSLIFALHAFALTLACPFTDIDLNFSITTTKAITANTNTASNYVRSIKFGKYNLPHKNHIQDLSSITHSIRIPHIFTFPLVLVKDIVKLVSYVPSRVLGQIAGGYYTNEPRAGEANKVDIKREIGSGATEQHKRELHLGTHICVPMPPFSPCYTYTNPVTSSSPSSSSSLLSPPWIFRLPIIILNLFSRIDWVIGAAIPSATSQGLGDEEGKMGVRSYTVAERILKMISSVFMRFGNGTSKGIGGGEIGALGDEACGGGSWRIALKRKWRDFGDGKSD